MTDYISREMTFDAICRLCNANFEEDPCEPSECEMMSLLCKIPAADVRPVVKARWNVGADGWECSNCAIESNNTYPICPYCGADMRDES